MMDMPGVRVEAVTAFSISLTCWATNVGGIRCATGVGLKKSVPPGSWYQYATEL